MDSNTDDKVVLPVLITEDNITNDNKKFVKDPPLLSDNRSVKKIDNTTQTSNLLDADNISKIINTPISKPKKGYFIQLASFNDQEKAKFSAGILNEKLAVSLGGNSLKVMKVDLGKGKGIWWRIVTNIMDRNDAETICALLKSEGNNCIVRSK